MCSCRVLQSLVYAIAAAAIVVLSAVPAKAWVDLKSPSNDSVASGAITVTASVTNEWWSQLAVDGKAVASAGPGNVSFRWDTGAFSDGPHWVTVRGYQRFQTIPDSSESIAVSVLNRLSADRSMTFATLPASAPLPSGSWCAQVIPPEAEMVAANQTPNNTVPTSSQLASYAANGYSANAYDGIWAYSRVNGQYKGTTDMIIRWAACKWGIDENVIRAQTTTEHWSWDQTTAHGDKRTSILQCINGNFTALWNYLCLNCCYQTWSNWQTKVFYEWATWPMINTSTAFAADFRYADQRACMNGDLRDYFVGRPAYNGHTYAGDIAAGNLDTILWGCIGFHYSGDWYDGNSTSGAVWYINYVKNVLANRDWVKHWPTFNWPN